MAKTKDSPSPPWLLYIASLSNEDPAARMRVLRTLDALGCAVLREGAYLLPDNAANRQGLTSLAEHVVRMNGSSYVLPVSDIPAEQSAAFVKLFDRSGKYVELIKTVQGLRAGFGISDPAAIARILSKQRRDLESIKALDFFPSDSRERAEHALDEADADVRKLMFPDASKPERTALPERFYLKRVWATRKPLWADRLASAWLIRRFIDPEAKLVWLERTQDVPPAAVGFAFEKATFTNSKDKVTFEELLASFNLGKDATLAKIGALVHYLDTGGAPVAEAAGVETLLQGARRRSSSDEELFLESEKTFDLLYEAYFESPGKNPA